ncbi:MAG: energy-coupled thiamine transporter ThiT [Clostridia bacterium]|nr:energy-coupled thiamine transporter ThiT [Clostridia bacterium]
MHFISGVTIYAKYMPESFLGMNMQNAAVYSLLYNGVYMLPSTVVTLIIVPVLYTATLKYLKD